MPSAHSRLLWTLSISFALYALYPSCAACFLGCQALVGEIEENVVRPGEKGRLERER